MRLLFVAHTHLGELLLTDRGPVDVESRASGEVRRFAPGLRADDAGEAMAWLSDSTEPRTAQVQVLSPGSLLLDGTAELSRLSEEGAWEDRQILVVGRLAEVQVLPGSWSASIVEDVLDDRGQLLDDGAVVAAATWPRSDANRVADDWPVYSTTPAGSSSRVEGAPYPVVLGLPAAAIPLRVAGVLWTGSLPGSPALYVERTASTTQVDDHCFLVAGHPVEASHVRWADVRTGASHREPVFAAHDKQGRQVTILTPGGSGSIPADDDAEVWIAWDPADGGGLSDPFGPGALRRADHVIRWALERSTLRIARRELPRLSALAGILIDTAITAQTSPWAWLSSELLPLLPVSIATGPDGLFVYPWLSALPASTAAQRSITVGRDAQRVGPWTQAPVDPVTRLTVSYSIDARSGRPVQTWTSCGKRRPSDVGDARVGLDYWAARAHAIVGERCEAVTAAIINDSASAQQIATWMLRSRCSPQWTVQLVLDEDETIRPGDVWRLTDPEMSLEVPVQVERVAHVAGATTIDVRTWAQPGPEVL